MSWAPSETLMTIEIAWWPEERKVTGWCDGVAAGELGEWGDRAGGEEGPHGLAWGEGVSGSDSWRKCQLS